MEADADAPAEQDVDMLVKMQGEAMLSEGSYSEQAAIQSSQESYALDLLQARNLEEEALRTIIINEGQAGILNTSPTNDDKKRRKRRSEGGGEEEGSIDMSPESKKQKRGEYLCSKCKQPKKGHTCPYSPDKKEKKKPKKREEEDTRVQTLGITGDLDVGNVIASLRYEMFDNREDMQSFEELLEKNKTLKEKIKQAETMASRAFDTNAENYACRWIGFPLKVHQGITEYSCLEVGTTTYSIGDCAYFLPDHGDNPSIGKIISMWQFNDKATPDFMFVNVVWFYGPENVQAKVRPHLQELFLGKSIDYMNVHFILGKCQVLTPNQWKDRQKGSELEPGVYFCQAYYDEFDFHPINPLGASGHSIIPAASAEFSDATLFESLATRSDQILYESSQAFLDEANSPKKRGRPATKRSSVHNWPSSVLYSRKLIGLGDLPPNVRMALSNQAENTRVALVEIKPIEDPQHYGYGGFGLFAKKDIKKLKILGEYTGKLTPSSISESGRKYISRVYEGTKISVYVDAEEIGNEFRFINDFRGTGKLRPNVRLESVPLNGEWHVLVISLKNIPRGKELLADFGEIRTHKYLSSENGLQEEEKHETQGSQRDGKEEEGTVRLEDVKQTEGEELLTADNH